MTTSSANIQSNLTKMVEPLKEQLDDLDDEIASCERDLASLRQTKRDVVRVLALIDPTFLPTTEKPDTKRSGKPGMTNTKVGDVTIREIRDFITAHPDLNNNGGFSAMVIRRHDAYKLGHRQQTVVEALKRLHNEGWLRLDHTGVAGSRFYKTVS